MSIRLMLPVLLLSLNSFSQTILKVQPTAVIHLSGGALLTLQDVDLDNDGTLNPAAGAGRLVFKGASNNIIKGTGITGFDELEIAKTGSGVLVLQNDVDIRSGIWFTGGIINLDNRVITLLGNSLLNGESETSRISATNGGYVQVNMQLNTPNAVNPGNLGAVITSSQSLGLTSIRRGHQQQMVTTGRSSVLRYFDIAPQTNTALNATLRLYYADAELNSQAENAIQFFTSDDLLIWTKKISGTRNAGSNYVELQGINSFSRITLADDGVGLPVIFAQFSVACGYNETLLSWITASEQNSSHFDIQRSVNGNTWTTIATVQAAGNSNTEKRYAYTDQQPQGKFYRIREVDLDSRSQLSQVVVANCENENVFKVWPNPVRDRLMIVIKAAGSGSAAIQVYNSKGQVVKMQNSSLTTGNNQLVVDMSSLPVGYYHVSVITNDGVRKGLTVFKK